MTRATGWAARVANHRIGVASRPPRPIASPGGHPGLVQTL